MPGWMNHNLESRLPEEISTTSMQMNATLMAESEEELKSLLMRVKEEREKVGLKLNIQTTKIMASSPITSWQIDGKTMEAVTDFIWGAPKSLQMVTAGIKLKDTLLGRKAMTNLDSVLKSRDITLPTRVHRVRALVLPIVVYRREVWTMSEAQR